MGQSQLKGPGWAGLGQAGLQPGVWLSYLGARGAISSRGTFSTRGSLKREGGSESGGREAQGRPTRPCCGWLRC